MRVCAMFIAIVVCAAAALGGGAPVRAAERARSSVARSERPAQPPWLLPASPRIARTRPPLPSSRALWPRPALGPPLATTPYVFADLGVPAGLSDPVPYAVNEHGDVAIAYCPAAGCSAAKPQYAYVFDAAQRRLIQLARFGSAPIEQYTPHGMNDAGQIVGWVTMIRNGNYATSPVLWTRVGTAGSKISLLDSTHNAGGQAYAINASGEIVGIVPGPFNFGIPVQFTGTTVASLIPPSSELAGSSGDVYALNDAGVATGDIGGNAVEYAPGNTFFIDLGPGYTDFAAGYAIDCFGNVYGTYHTTDYGGLPFGPVGFLAPAGSGPNTLAQTLFYGDEEYQIFGVNNADAYIGYFYGGYSIQYVGPFVYAYNAGPTLLADYVPPGSTIVPLTATAINNKNQIVGQATNGGRTTVFEMTPAVTASRRAPASRATRCLPQLQ